MFPIKPINQRTFDPVPIVLETSGISKGVTGKVIVPALVEKSSFNHFGEVEVVDVDSAISYDASRHDEDNVHNQVPDVDLQRGDVDL